MAEASDPYYARGNIGFGAVSLYGPVTKNFNDTMHLSGLILWLFGILVPIALGILGLTVGYGGWFIFLLIGTVVYGIYPNDAYYFQLIKKGIGQTEVVNISKQIGQELLPTGKLIESMKISAKIPQTWALVALYFISFGGFAVPPIFGVFIDSYGKTGYSKGFIVYALLSVVGMVISITLMKNKRG